MVGNIGVIGYISDAAQLRAAHYRDQAVCMLNMAVKEPVTELRYPLVDLAHEYHQLAATLEERHQTRRIWAVLA
jgi:hypothetical protein